MSELDDVLKGAMEHSDALKQRDLLNKTFTLKGYRDSPTGKGYIIVAEVDGQESDYWFSGVIAERQLQALIQREMIPCQLVLRQQESDGSGKTPPYFIESPEGGSATSPPERVEATATVQAKLTKYVKAIGLPRIEEIMADNTLHKDIAPALAYTDDGRLKPNLKSLSLPQIGALNKALDAALGSEEDLPFE